MSYKLLFNCSLRGYVSNDFFRQLIVDILTFNTITLRIAFTKILNYNREIFSNSSHLILRRLFFLLLFIIFNTKNSDWRRSLESAVRGNNHMVKRVFFLYVCIISVFDVNERLSVSYNGFVDLLEKRFKTVIKVYVTVWIRRRRHIDVRLILIEYLKYSEVKCEEGAHLLIYLHGPIQIILR